jgi:hypothetical protein
MLDHPPEVRFDGDQAAAGSEDAGGLRDSGLSVTDPEQYVLEESEIKRGVSEGERGSIGLDEVRAGNAA